MSPAIGSLEKALRFGEGRRLKRLQEQAAYVATLEPDFQKLSDDALRAKTVEFRERLENGEELESLLFEAFAAVREARLRESDQRIFDVQMMGGIALHEGDIAEMKTGEGKTFVASLPLYLNALEGLGAHLVTVNDYLATRDAEWNRPVYERLGMSVAAIENNMPFDRRKAAYDSDITYGTNSEFGFDYLRDNMAISLEGVVQRGHRYAIVDEVDSILIDEARTPLIISGEPTTAARTYYDFARVVKGLDGAQSKGTKLDDEALAQEHDFLYDEKHKTVSPTESGIEKVERALRIDNLYDHVLRVYDELDTQRDLLTGILEAHLSVVSNRLNEVVLKLSSWAGIVLVPTLIAGIYGMNFREMPELHWQFGYLYALGLMVLSGAVLWWRFRRAGWL